MDIDARMQLFDFKTTYRFETIPGICDYNMPLYSAQNEPGSQVISPFPIYQGLMAPAYVNGIELPFFTQRDTFFRLFPNYIPYLQEVGIGDGVTTNFQFSLPSGGQSTNAPVTGFWQSGVIPGHIDMTGIISTGATQDPIFTNSYVQIPSTSVKPGVTITYTNANGSNTVITDSGQFLQSGTNQNLFGLLMQPGNPPNGDSAMPGGYSTTVNTVNYNTGIVNVSFPLAPPAQSVIQVQSTFYQPGIPRQCLFYNNTITLRAPPNSQYLIELDAYLTPAAMLTTSQALPFAYMAEYIARGAARKILSDTGDWEQFAAYEPLFIEQERLVWKRSQRIWTSTRTPTLFSQGIGVSNSNYNNMGLGGF